MELGYCQYPNLSQAALLVFLPPTAGTDIVSADFIHRSLRRALICLNLYFRIVFCTHNNDFFSGLGIMPSTVDLLLNEKIPEPGNFILSPDPARSSKPRIPRPHYFARLFSLSFISCKSLELDLGAADLTANFASSLFLASRSLFCLSSRSICDCKSPILSSDSW